MTPEAEKIIRSVLEEHQGVTRAELLDTSQRTRRIVRARHKVWRRLHELRGGSLVYSLSNIARWFSSHHSTIYYALYGQPIDKRRKGFAYGSNQYQIKERR